MRILKPFSILHTSLTYEGAGKCHDPQTFPMSSLNCICVIMYPDSHKLWKTSHESNIDLKVDSDFKAHFFFILGELLYATILLLLSKHNGWGAWNIISYLLEGEPFPATGEILGILELRVLDVALVCEPGTKEIIYFVQCTSEHRNTPIIPRHPGEKVPVSVCCKLPSE